jgi:hypothetical protein
MRFRLVASIASATIAITIQINAALMGIGKWIMHLDPGYDNYRQHHCAQNEPSPRFSERQAASCWQQAAGLLNSME